MNVIFHRTGARRYAVSVQWPGQPASTPVQGPGFDPLLPHDLAHLLAEAELGLEHGVFGQVARGGNLAAKARIPGRDRAAARLERKRRRRAERLEEIGREETRLSEEAANICRLTWLSRFPRPELGHSAWQLEEGARRMRERLRPQEREMLTAEAIHRIVGRMAALSPVWARLEVGESMTVPWEPKPIRPARKRA